MGMSPIVRPEDLLAEVLDLYDREASLDGYRPALVETTLEGAIKRPTWPQLVKHQPALADLLRDFDRATDISGTCPQDVWYAGSAGGFKRRMAELVGRWAATKDPFLCTSEAYDVAYQAFMKILAPKQNAWAERQDQLPEN